MKGEGLSEVKGENATWREILRVHISRIIRVLEEDGPRFLAARKTQLLIRQFFRLNRGKGACNLHASVLRQVEQQRPPSNRVSAKVERALRVLRLKKEENANAVKDKSKRSLNALQHLHHVGLFLEGMEYGLRVILLVSNLSITIIPCHNIQTAEHFTVPQ